MEKLFLLEVLVENVEIDYTKLDIDKCVLYNAKQLCIKFQFLSFPELTICEEDFCTTDGDYSKNLINIKSGKSCLFSIRKWNIEDKCVQIKVTVLRQNPSPPHITVGCTCIKLGSSFTDILAATQSPENTDTVTKKCTDVYTLTDNNGTDIGKIRVFVRLTCFGPLIVTQFQLSGDENNSFLFRGNDGSGIVTFNRNITEENIEKQRGPGNKGDPCDPQSSGRPADCPPCPPCPPDAYQQFGITGNWPGNNTQEGPEIMGTGGQDIGSFGMPGPQGMRRNQPTIIGTGPMLQGTGGPEMMQGAGGPGMKQGAGGPGMMQGVGGPGMMQGAGGLGMMQGPGGPGMMQGPGGPGMMHGAAGGPGMMHGAGGPGMIQGAGGPGMMQGVGGPGMMQGGAGLGLAQGATGMIPGGDVGMNPGVGAGMMFGSAPSGGFGGLGYGQGMMNDGQRMMLGSGGDMGGFATGQGIMFDGQGMMSNERRVSPDYNKLDYKEFGAEVNGHSLSIKVLRKPRKAKKPPEPMPFCGHVPISKVSSSSSSDGSSQFPLQGIQFCECDYPLPPGFTMPGSRKSKKKKNKKNKEKNKCPLQMTGGDCFKSNCPMGYQNAGYDPSGKKEKKKVNIKDGGPVLKDTGVKQAGNKQIGMIGNASPSLKTVFQTPEEEQANHSSGKPTFILNVPPQVYTMQQQKVSTPFQNNETKVKKVSLQENGTQVVDKEAPFHPDERNTRKIQSAVHKSGKQGEKKSKKKKKKK